jgi:hypothetical protein
MKQFTGTDKPGLFYTLNCNRLEICVLSQAACQAVMASAYPGCAQRGRGAMASAPKKICLSRSSKATSDFSIFFRDIK